MKTFIGQELELKEMSTLYFGNPDVKVGNKYKILDVDGSNFIFKDDSNEQCSIGSCRFIIPDKNDKN